MWASLPPSLLPTPSPPQEILGTRVQRRGSDGAAAKKGLPRGVITPQSTLRLSWDVVGMFLLVYLAFALPFQLAFHLRDWTLLGVIVDL